MHGIFVLAGKQQGKLLHNMVQSSLLLAWRDKYSMHGTST